MINGELATIKHRFAVLEPPARKSLVEDAYRLYNNDVYDGFYGFACVRALNREPSEWLCCASSRYKNGSCYL